MCWFYNGRPEYPKNRCCHYGCSDKSCVKPTHLQWGTCYESWANKYKGHWSIQTEYANSERHGKNDTSRTFPCYDGLSAENATQPVEPGDKRELSVPFAELIDY